MTTTETGITPFHPASEYAIMQPDENGFNFEETLALNLGDGQISMRDFVRAKIPSGGGLQFTVDGLSGPQPVDVLEGIIVTFGRQRGYWPGKFAGAVPPVCSSTDGINGDGLYGPGSEGNPTGKCKVCPMAKFGSADLTDDSNNRQACKAMDMVFLLPKESRLPILLSVPPASLENFRKFRVLITQSGYPLHAVTARAYLAPATSKDNITYSQVKWTGDKADNPAAVADTIGKYAAAFRALIGQQTLLDFELADDDVIDANPAPAPAS